MSLLSLSGKYNLVKGYDLGKNPAYYDIGITQTIKNIVETGEKNRDIVINVGSYTYDASGNLIGSGYTNSQSYNTRAYAPERALFLSTITNVNDPLYSKGAKLLITYGKK